MAVSQAEVTRQIKIAVPIGIIPTVQQIVEPERQCIGPPRRIDHIHVKLQLIGCILWRTAARVRLIILAIAEILEIQISLPLCLLIVDANEALNTPCILNPSSAIAWIFNLWI